MANLTLRELQKHECRIATLLDKMSKCEPLATCDGLCLFVGTHVIHRVKNDTVGIYDARVESEKLMAHSVMMVSGPKDRFFIRGLLGEVPIGKLHKTEEFGGKSSTHGLKKQNFALNQLKAAVKNVMAAYGGPMPLAIGTTVIEDVVDVEEVLNPKVKADFRFVNSKGVDVGWLSHKDGNLPRHFPQWGGMSNTYESKIHNHVETQSFIGEVKRLYPTGLTKGMSFHRPIADRNLCMLSVYGNEFGCEYSHQNVNAVVQGNFTVAASGHAFMLGGDVFHVNGEDVHGGYVPSFLAAYKTGRNDQNCNCTRFTISPLGGRVNSAKCI